MEVRGLELLSPSDAMDITEVLREIRGIDFDAEMGQQIPYPNYQTRYITTHKNSCTCASFSSDGMGLLNIRFTLQANSLQQALWIPQ
jgi:hypothetical protein